MNLKDCVRFSDSLVLQQLVKTRSEGYLGHGGEGIGVRNFGFDSLKTMFKHDIEEKGIVAVMRDSCQFTSGPFLRRSIVPSSRSYADSSGWTPPAAPPAEESAYDREDGTMEHRRNGPKVN